MVEIEGKEVVQTPGGVFKAEGPSHEQGGIKLELPDGTNIFSKRLKIDGKSMADRKEARERRFNKALKSLEENPFDPFVQGTLERVLERNTMEEYHDLMFQEAKNTKVDNFKWGGTVKKYPDGKPGSFANAARIAYDAVGGINPMLASTLLEDYLMINPDNTHGNVPVAKPTYDDMVSPYKQPVDPGVKPTAKQGGLGDFLGNLGRGVLGASSSGPVGVAVGALGPLVTTIVNRLGDKKNENFYDNYGQEGLAVNTLTGQGLDANRQNTLSELNRGSNLPTGASSVNVDRALRQGIASATQRATNQTQADFATRISDVLASRVNLLNERDRMKMAGAEQANIRDIQDRDQFFTNLSKNLSNVSTGIMHAARNKRKITLDDLLYG